MSLKENESGYDRHYARFQNLESEATDTGSQSTKDTKHRSNPSLAKPPGHIKKWIVMFTVGLISLLPAAVYGKRKERDWKIGLLLSNSQARHFVMMLHNSQTNTTSSTDVSGNVSEEGSLSASGTTRSSANTNGYSVPVYRVYETYVVKGNSEYYVARERLRWRWSKAADAAIGERIKYAVQGRSLYLLDDQGHEHHATIVQRVLRSEVHEAQPVESGSAEAIIGPTSSNSTGAFAKLTIKSSPDGADITVDGKFVGNAPSTIRLAPGNHVVGMSKPGFKPWQRTVSINGASEITLDATLEKAQQ